MKSGRRRYDNHARAEGGGGGGGDWTPSLNELASIMWLLYLQRLCHIVSEFKGKATVVLCTETSASAVQSMKVLWKLILMTESNGKKICASHGSSRCYEASVWRHIMPLDESEPPFIHTRHATSLLNRLHHWLNNVVATLMWISSPPPPH